MATKKDRFWVVDNRHGEWIRLATVNAAVRRAVDLVAFKHHQVDIYWNAPGEHKMVGVLTSGMFWIHVTDDRLKAAIERFEVEGR